MVGLMSGGMVNRGVRRAMPGMRKDDETMFAPRMGSEGPKGPTGEGFGASPDMMAPMPNPGEEGTPAGQGESEQPNVSPEEQKQYDGFIENGLRLIFDKRTVPGILQRIKSSPSPSEGLASATVAIVTRLKDSAEKNGIRLEDAVLMHGGAEIMENIAELSKAAGVHEYTPDEIETAMYQALDQYGTREMERGTLDKETLSRNFQMMMEADKAGKIDDILPGLSERAKEIKARGQKPAGMMEQQES